jgi:Spy/CpxP family protein refolding chaperone
MTRNTFTAALLAIAIGSGARAFAHGGMGGLHGHDGFGGPGGAMYGRLLQALDLTADQKQKIHDIMKAHHEKFASLGAAARSAHEALADKLFSTGPLTASDLDGVVQQATRARSDLMHEGLAVAVEVRGVLTPAQIAKAAQIHGQMKSLRAQMQQLLGSNAEPE